MGSYAEYNYVYFIDWINNCAYFNIIQIIILRLFQKILRHFGYVNCKVVCTAFVHKKTKTFSIA